MLRRTTISCIPFVSALLMLTLLALAPPAGAWSGYKHGTAQSKGTCAAGCHAETAPTNTTCTSCHAGFRTQGTQKCWDCHEPGQSTVQMQLLPGCTSTCHVSTATGDRPSYTASFAHSGTVHLGASGYGKTCVACHGVSTGSTAPGRSPHHDAVNSAVPPCTGCHDGVIAATPTDHTPYGVVCSSCHKGMDRPSGDCATCHVGRLGTSAPQITYSNDLTCGAAACHAKVANHAGTPIGAAACTTCHTGHYQALGTCITCHADPQTLHHATATAHPLADCARCHDGGIATARKSHSVLACSTCHTGMGVPEVPAVCAPCHSAREFGSATCTSCHSLSGMMGREQIHNATPTAGIACTTCHAAHNADLGTCQTCHGKVPEAHHGVIAPKSSVLTLEASPSALKPGTRAELRGVLTDGVGEPLAGVQLLLQERRLPDGAFVDVATLSTVADGSIAQRVQPVAGTEYRAVYRGASSAATIARPAIAKASVTVAQAVRLRARPTTVRRGAKVRLSGTVAPAAQKLGAAPGRVSLRIERKSGSRWRRVAAKSVTASTSGTYSWSWKAKKAGTYRIRATAAATSGVRDGVSRWVKMKVR